MPDARIRVAIAQVNPTVGDLKGNATKVLDWARRAADAGAQLLVFPELTLTGQPVQALARRLAFVEDSAQAPHDLATCLDSVGLGQLPTIVGYLDGGADGGPDRLRTTNTAAWLQFGDVQVVAHKPHVSSVSNPDRCECQGPSVMAAKVWINDVLVAVQVGDRGAAGADRVADPEADLVVVLQSLPFRGESIESRTEHWAAAARKTGTAFAIVNMVGGQDELVYDGGSMLVDGEGRLVARAPQFTEHLLVADLTVPVAAPGSCDSDSPDLDTVVFPAPPLAARGTVSPKLDPCEAVYAALVLSLRDYARKNDFRSVVLGLSGGVDSALVATLAADALGPENVHVVLMPSRYSSEHSVTDAEDLVRRQGLQSQTIPIHDLMDEFQAKLTLQGVAEENLQVRIRGTIIMGLSNEYGHLVLMTANKSELSAGNLTLYSDTAGGFGPIQDVYKTQVWELCRWRNQEAERAGETPPIPSRIIDKEPSGELRPGQLDADFIPDYRVFDSLVQQHVEGNDDLRGIAAAAADPAFADRVLQMVRRTEFKRRQYPVGPVVTTRSYGCDWQMPITNAWQG